MRSSSRLGTWSRVAFFAPLVAAVGILLWTCRCRQADGAPPPDRSSACKELYAPLENGILDLLELKAELFFADYDKWGYYITNAATLRTRLNTLQQCPRGVGICATMRQENSYLQEWLAWHILVGVQHFYLRDDNRGREGGRTQSILQPFIDLGYVTIIPSSKLPANALEIDVFTACTRHYGHEVEWMAFMNVDEFIVDKEKRCIYDRLKEYDQFAGFAIQWALFTSSGYLTSQAHRLTLETYKYRWPFNEHFKTIARPQFVAGWDSPHWPLYRWPENFTVDFARRRVHHTIPDTPPSAYDVIQLNHYWTRSLEEFLRKAVRGNSGADGTARRTLLDFRLHDLRATANDTSVFPRLPELRYLLGLRDSAY